MKAVIVEDEIVASQSLERLIKAEDESIEIVAVLQSVEESIEWFSINAAPDVVFMDIHLADGDSFSIFEKTDIRCPIIFTTAYDEYAIKAFEVNSIGYLLKPISQKSLQKALGKLTLLSHGNNDNTVLISQIMNSIRRTTNPYKTYFLIPVQDKLIPLAAKDIAFVYSEHKMAKIACFNNQQYMMDISLDELLKQLDPAKFFRANRQFIIAHHAITDLSMWFGGKLSVNLLVHTPEKIIVSRSRSAEFKDWYMQVEK